MSGIIGYIGNKRVVPVLLEGLQRLQYRGYDSAGLAVMHDGKLDVRRSTGKLRNLEEKIRLDPAGRRLRHRAHALGHARRSHGGERPPASRLPPNRGGGSQRHH